MLLDKDIETLRIVSQESVNEDQGQAVAEGSAPGVVDGDDEEEDDPMSEYFRYLRFGLVFISQCFPHRNMAPGREKASWRRSWGVRTGLIVALASF